jgi:hypothetical protein
MLPIAALAASEVPWKWGFVGMFVVTAFGLQVLVRVKNNNLERLVHILVLSGTAPTLVRVSFGRDLGALAVVHVAALLTISIGFGYWLAEQVRPTPARPGAR